MKSYNDTLPKPLIDINGKPLVSYIINKYLNFVDEIILLTGYRHRVFLEYKFNKKVSILYTGLNSTTLERLNKVKNLVDDDFFLTYGDSLADINLLKSLQIHRKSKNIISSSYYDYYFPYGIYQKKNTKINLIEKCKFTLNSGFYVCSKNVFRYTDRFKYFEKELIPYLIKKNLFNYEYEAKNWFPVDNYTDVINFKLFLNKNK